MADQAKPHMVRCGTCLRPPEEHADSDAGPMSVCPPRDLLQALADSIERAKADRRGGVS